MSDLEGQLDVLITGGTLLTMAAPGEVIENPRIGIRNGRIQFVGQASSETPRTARRVIDASSHIILPGLVNVHTHLPMVLFRGLADDLPLLEWLNNHMFPVEARFITPKNVRAATMLACAEMIRSGTTTFCDGYFFEDVIAEATLASGMRGVVAQGFIDFPTPDQPDPTKKWEMAEAFLLRWQGRSPLITPALVCHSPYTCSPETLRTVKEISRRHGALFQIHLAETREEVAMLLERYGKKPVVHLHDLGLLDAQTVAAHCVWVDREEIALLATQDVKVAHDPESNMKLGVGVAPVLEMLRQGVTVGLGTDGCASNNNLDLFGEMAMCSKMHKVFSGNPSAMSAERVLEMATMGGARVLGMDQDIGSVSPGKWADLILVAMDRPHLTPLYNPFSHLVYAASGADVDTVLIGGQVMMSKGRLENVNETEAMKDVLDIAETIKAAGYIRRSRGE